MSVNFGFDRWEKIRQIYAAWWAGSLNRPLIAMPLSGRDPGRPEPALPWHNFQSNYALDVPSQAIIDRVDFELSKTEHLGDSFPAWWPNFGPGVSAAFMGCDLQSAPDTVWFYPREKKEIGQLSLRHDPSTPWLPRVKDLCRTGAEHWQGQVCIGMTDLGGNLDIVSSFLPGEELLTAVLTDPDEVKRLGWEAHARWWEYFSEIDATMRPLNPGYSAWAPLYSEIPYYILQCDFAYMLGPDMFDEFVKPELEATAKRLGNVFYHLDGVGQLAHLDSLLAIPEIKGIQWIPGAGKGDWSDWIPILKKIQDAGKLTQIWGDGAMLDKIVAGLGSGKGIMMCSGWDTAHRREAESLLRKYGVD